MFGWEFPPFNSGGLGIACAGLSKALVASGVPLTFALPIKIPISAPWCKFVFGDDFGGTFTTKELELFMSGYQTTSKEKDNILKLKGAISGSLMQKVMRYGDKAYLMGRKIDHDIIHAHDWLCYPAGIAAKKASGRPLVVHVHATQFDQSGGDNVNQAVYEIEREGMHAADRVVTVSGRTRDLVIKKYGIHPEKVSVVYNGVEFENSNGSIPDTLMQLKMNGSKIVLFAGRITLQKGPDYFVSMAKRIVQKEPNTYFVVSGSGDMESQMIRNVAESGLSDKFIFCGFLKGEELSNIFKAADIFVMPSVSEPFGIVPLESMLSDTPVLISKESGVAEILSTALKSHFWDIDDMADKVISVLRHSKLKNHLSVHGKKEAGTIHWKKAADTLIPLYNSLHDAFGMLLFPSSPALEGAKVPSF